VDIKGKTNQRIEDVIVIEREFAEEEAENAMFQGPFGGLRLPFGRGTHLQSKPRGSSGRFDLCRFVFCV